jgi:hypothetical protein
MKENLITIARSKFAECGIDVSNAADAGVLRAYRSILGAAAVTARPADDFFRAIREFNDFCAQPHIDPKWNLNLKELFDAGL